jgi:hypothetical protein
MALAPKVPIRTEVTEVPLEAAGNALEALRAGTAEGSLVLRVGQTSGLVWPRKRARHTAIRSWNASSRHHRRNRAP